MTLVALAQNPVPSGAMSGVLRTRDGVDLRFARWSETRPPQRGTVVVIPGRGEFIEKYFEVVADLRRRGYSVVVLDLRGQGGSDRLLDNPGKGHVRSFRDYDRDLAQLMTEVVLPQCPAPYIGLGHSLGGHILLRHAPARDSWFQRILVTAPMIELARERTKMSQASVRAYTEIVCALGLSRMFVLGGTARPAETGPFEGNFVTGDRERYERARAVLLAAPEISLGSPTVGWLRAACRSMATLQAPDYPRSVRVPTLMVAAGRDQIVSTTRIEAFALRLKLGSHVLIAPSKHEILMESDDIRARFWATFDAYLGVAAVAA